MRTIVAERWGVLRHGLVAVLRHGGHDVVRAVDTAPAAAALLAVRHDVELVVLGATHQPPATALALVREAAPAVRIVVLADQPTPRHIEALRSAGAALVLERGSERTDLRRAVDRLVADDRPLAGEGGEAAPSSLGPVLQELDGQLTSLERDIVRWLARGASAQEIATQLFIGQAALTAHEAAILRKLGASTREQAIARAMHLGLLGAAVTWTGGAPSSQRAS